MFFLGTINAHKEHLEVFMQNTLLNAKQLSQRIMFSASYINHSLKDNVFIEGIHYIRPFGGRKILYIWQAIEKELYKPASTEFIVPMTKGGVCHG